MLDGLLRKLIDPGVGRYGSQLAALGWTANRMTLLGLGLGLVAAAMIALNSPGWLALLPLLASRVADGLDGGIARATQKTDFGGFLDIVADFLFYGAIPLAFALRLPEANAVAAAFVLMTFYANGASFLAYAVLAERRGMQTSARGEKSLYFTSGLLEGTETIAFFAVICLWPGSFPVLAWIFGTLCLYTTAARVLLARRVFGPKR
ncbi:MAG: CDP-alcohol phosphatidyltransferase family protein [Candidatus Saccharibacteria bacterium]|nr:CDP-alcohol phosphatidyltransferase family protein [Pseudorhodobacter sp.]